MELPEDYYHCFLGNGLDAVLVGYTGSMVADRVGVDRCVWYKSDRYYPETKLVQVAGRFPTDRPLEHAVGSGWYEIAPLGRTWYEVIWHGQPLSVQASQQRLVPQEGTLHSRVDYGPVQVEVTTLLHASRSLLVERYGFSQTAGAKQASPGRRAYSRPSSLARAMVTPPGTLSKAPGPPSARLAA